MYFLKLKQNTSPTFHLFPHLPRSRHTTVSLIPLPPPPRTLPAWGGCWDGGLRPSGACAEGPHSRRVVHSWCSARRAYTGTGGRYPTSFARPRAAGTRTAPCSFPGPGLGLLTPGHPQYSSLSPSSCLSPRRLGQHAHPQLFIAISPSHDPPHCHI